MIRVPIVRMQFGSHVYGTNTPESDMDYKSVMFPTVRELLTQKSFTGIKKTSGNDQSKNTKDDVDEDIYSLHHYFKLLLNADVGALDMLFTPDKFILTNSREWRLIRNRKDIFLHKSVASYSGYCSGQAAKYGLKGSNLAAFELVYKFFDQFLYHTPIHSVIDRFNEEIIETAKKESIYHDKGEPIIKIVDIAHKVTGKIEQYIQVGSKTKVPLNASCGLAASIYQEQAKKYGERAKLAKLNKGVDYKALSHAVRVCRQAEELLLTGNMTFPIQDPDILRIKKGEIPYLEIAEMITDGLDRVSAAKEKSKLPDEPDFKAVDDLLYEICEDFVIDEMVANPTFKHRFVTTFME